jgi:hypothetical protein
MAVELLGNAGFEGWIRSGCAVERGSFAIDELGMVSSESLIEPVCSILLLTVIAEKD